ncbi:TPA: O-antigen ligase family protein [Bacillus cereus]|uniref:O-antigen ligase family protein n=1 Tax=Bacillus TaxID=1386 RepID=UPI0008640E80|nr:MULTISPECIES: O-antigen ligase family protein [Bacillus]MCP1177495.1 O-antigen ligase family protein [Bacillus sp. 1663tsa1]MCP1283352.1 O-antigen ligase family protein [Bacillus sp. S0635]MCQ6346888.1 O-antigen ligase family protein [Bacillus cereus]MCU5748856.1 O-antigen ligase family protein [Bacillus cereus]MDA1634713.1 O-antigen ligase family protein [Bacillus cereus]
MLSENIKSNKFENFLLIFILLQPILDLLTAFCIMVLKIDTTIGVITRLFVMFLSGIYILIQTKKQGNIKYILYIILVGIVFTIGLVNNKFTKDPMVLTEEIKFIAKALYPFVMLTCYVFVFKSLKEKSPSNSKMRDYITYASLIIGVVMVASITTGTDYNSYEWVKLGSRGWFYAGNELGSILAIMCPIVILYSIEKTKSIGKAYYWIPSILVVYSLFAIGTKVGVGAIFGSMAIAVVMCFIQAFTQRKDGKKHAYLLNGFLAITVFVGILAYTPFSPFMKNMGFHFQLIEQEQSAKKEEKKKEEAKEHKPPVTEQEKEKEKAKEKVAEKKEETQALIFSGRQLFEQMYKDFYNEAPMSQKLLGMGYAGNYKEQPKLIERDFHDWFYSFGIIGFILLVIPFLYFGIKFIACIFTKFKQIFTVKYAMMIAAILLGLGISFMAGHILIAPGVSFYLVLIMAYLIVDLEIE